MDKNVKVNVPYLTRVEGHGNIVVNVREGRLQECRLDIVESPRFFEGMLRGRSIFEAQHITSRICGICACGHSLASIQAAEDALGLVPSVQTVLLRKLLLHQEILDSHILHIYLLAVPDLLGVPSFMPLIGSHNQVVRRALRMKKACNDICAVLAGRHIHPIGCIVGGFTRIPEAAEVERIRDILLELAKDAEATVELVKTLSFPSFERETEYVALVNDENAYPLLHGELGSSDGLRLPKERYRELANEFIVEHSSAKHARASRESYMVGALARFNLNGRKLHPKAQSTAATLGLRAPVHNPYLNTAAQLVECVHCVEDSLILVEEMLRKGLDRSEAVTVGMNERGAIPMRAGKGVGAVEVPRGLLFHAYEIDETGRIIAADCVIPTSQNANNIEHDMRKLIPEILDLPEADITLRLEMLVRAYDPCISCSAHFLNIQYVER